MSMFNIHEILLFARNLLTLGCENTFFKIFAADLNVFALSETMISGKPLLAVNLRRQWINTSGDKFVASSRGIALVQLQVNNWMSTFFVVEQFRSFMYSGAA